MPAPATDRLLHRCLLAVAFLLAIASGPAAASPSAAADLYEKALVSFNGKDLPTAVIHLKNALKEEPGYVPALVLLGRAYLAQGELGSAEQTLLDAEKRGADPALTTPPLAECYVRQRKFSSIIDGLKVDNLPAAARSDVLVSRAKALLTLGRRADARADLDTAARLAPASLTPLATLITVDLAEGKFDSARDQAERLIARAPDSAQVYSVRGAVRHALGDLEGALADYAAALQREPGDVDTRVARVGLLIDLDRDKEALPDLDVLKGESAFDPRAAYLRAVVLGRAGDKAGASAALAEATNIIDVLPKDLIASDPQLQLLAGLAHMSQGQTQEARPYLERYVINRPREPGPRRLLGSALMSAGEYSSAVDMLEEALRLAPHDPATLTLLATAYGAQRRHLDAVRLLEPEVAAQNGKRDLRTQLALSRLSLGQVEQGISELAALFAEDSTQLRAGLALASGYLKQGDPARAVNVAQKLVAQEPKNVQFLDLLGNASFASGDAAAARTAWTSAAAVDAKFIPARIGLARVDLASGDAAAARKRLEAIVAERPDDTAARIELSRVAEREGRFDDALRFAEQAVGADKAAVAPLTYQAELLLRRGEAQKAIDVALAADQVHGDDLNVLQLLARAQIAANRKDDARVTLKHMGDLAQFDADALYRIAGLQVLAEAPDDARYLLGKALQGRPDFRAAEAALAGLEIDHGTPESAEKQVQALLQRHPDAPEAHQLEGDLRRRLGQAAEAEASYRRALERGASNIVVMRLYGILRATGRGTEATRTLLDWLDAHPDDTAIAAALAEDHLTGRRYAEARSLYERLLAQSPQDPGLLNNLANTLLALGERAAALERARAAQALAPGNPTVNDTLGWLLVLDGKAADGLAYLRDAVARAAGNLEIRYHLAAALEQLGRSGEAATEIEAVFAGGDPAFDDLEAARALREKLRK